MRQRAKIIMNSLYLCKLYFTFGLTLRKIELYDNPDILADKIE